MSLKVSVLNMNSEISSTCIKLSHGKSTREKKRSADWVIIFDKIIYGITMTQSKSQLKLKEIQTRY